MDTLKIALGLIVIAASFVFIIKNPQCMMDTLLKKRKIDEEKLREEYAARQAAKAAEEAAKSESVEAEEADN